MTNMAYKGSIVNPLQRALCRSNDKTGEERENKYWNYMYNSEFQLFRIYNSKLKDDTKREFSIAIRDSSFDVTFVIAVYK